MKILNFKTTSTHTNELGDEFIAYKDNDNHLLSVCTKDDTSSYTNHPVSGIVVMPDDVFSKLNLTEVTS